jgi:hypothetical protein
MDTKDKLIDKIIETQDEVNELLNINFNLSIQVRRHFITTLI